MKAIYQGLAEADEVVGDGVMRNLLLVLILIEMVYPGSIGWAAAAIWAAMVIVLSVSVAASLKLNGFSAEPAGVKNE